MKNPTQASIITFVSPVLRFGCIWAYSSSNTYTPGASKHNDCT